MEPKVIVFKAGGHKVPVLGQTNRVHIGSHNLFQTHFNISSYLSLGLLSNLFRSGSPANISNAFIISPVRATCSTHFI
jgi:hypothetical protein